MMIVGVEHVADSPNHTRSSHYELMLELAYDLSGSLDVGEVLTRALTATRRVIDFRGGSIALIEDGALSIAVSEPAVGPEVAALRLPVGQGLSGRVAQTGHSIYSRDLHSDDRVDPSVRKLDTNAAIRTYFAVPVVASGTVVGVLQVDSETIDAFDDEQRAMVASLAPLIGAAIQNARVFTAELETESKLQELERLRADFISITSHELRTPLTAVLGFAELLASKQGPVPGGADSGEIVDRLMAALHRLKALIREVQRLAAVDAGSLDPKKEPLELTAVVDKAMGPFARARPFRIAIAQGTHVMGDEDRLTDVFRALFDNAVAFSPEGSPIEVVAKRDDDTILVSVVDGGKGIPSQDTQKIFERFAQREPPNTREVGGLGIGLPVARGIIERMGGTLDVVPGPRGHFVIALPGGE